MKESCGGTAPPQCPGDLVCIHIGHIDRVGTRAESMSWKNDCIVPRK